MTKETDQEYTGGKVNYYEAEITHPTREVRAPYTAECNDIIEALGLTFAEGEAFKAIWRKGSARIKPGKRGYDGGLYDAEKASFYGRRMEIIEKNSIGKPAGQTMADSFGQQNMWEPAAEIDDSSERMQAIGQNGNDGAAYLAGNIDRHPETPRHHCGACGLNHALHQCTGGQMEGKPTGDCDRCQGRVIPCDGECLL